MTLFVGQTDETTYCTHSFMLLISVLKAPPFLQKIHKGRETDTVWHWTVGLIELSCCTPYLSTYTEHKTWKHYCINNIIYLVDVKQNMFSIYRLLSQISYVRHKTVVPCTALMGVCSIHITFHLSKSMLI